MLTLKPRMDHMGRPTDPFAASPNLMRQPSAEDLDAAHQLVSSARGGRSSIGNHEKMCRNQDAHGPFLDGGSTDRVTAMTVASDHSVLSGQVCRYKLRSACIGVNC
jgi:hypothetical protein